MGDPTARLLDLDTRHCELLDRLAELDQQVNDVLNEWTRSKELFLEEQEKRNRLANMEAVTISSTAPAANAEE